MILLSSIMAKSQLSEVTETLNEADPNIMIVKGSFKKIKVNQFSSEFEGINKVLDEAKGFGPEGNKIDTDGDLELQFIPHERSLSIGKPVYSIGQNIDETDQTNKANFAEKVNYGNDKKTVVNL